MSTKRAVYGVLSMNLFTYQYVSFYVYIYHINISISISMYTSINLFICLCIYIYINLSLSICRWQLRAGGGVQNLAESSREIHLRPASDAGTGHSTKCFVDVYMILNVILISVKIMTVLVYLDFKVDIGSG